MKNKKELLIISAIGIISLTIYIIIATLVYKNDGDIKADKDVMNFIYDNRGEKYGFIYFLFRIITEFGFIYFSVTVLVLGLIYCKANRWSLLYIFGYALANTLNVVNKAIFNRERPEESLQWAHESDSSFPSGHSTSAAFVFSFLMYYVIRNVKNKHFKIPLIIICVLMIPAVMLSRLVLGMHYLTDVIAGAMTGLVAFTLTAYLCMLCEHYDIFTIGILDFKGRKNEKDNINS